MKQYHRGARSAGIDLVQPNAAHPDEVAARGISSLSVERALPVKRRQSCQNRDRSQRDGAGRQAPVGGSAHSQSLCSTAQPIDGRCDRSGRQAARRPFVLSLRENSAGQPTFQAGVNFRVRPGAFERNPFAISLQVFVGSHDLIRKVCNFSGSCLFEHDPFRKPLHTFRDHALGEL